jgi:hypothetical protein
MADRRRCENYSDIATKAMRTSRYRLDSQPPHPLPRCFRCYPITPDPLAKRGSLIEALSLSETDCRLLRAHKWRVLLHPSDVDRLSFDRDDETND